MRLVQVEKRYVKFLNEKNCVKYLSFGYTDIDVDGEERPQCLLCMDISIAARMKRNKLKGHLETVNANCVGKTTEFFHRNLNEFNK